MTAAPFTLASACPRLAHARDERLIELVRERAARRRCRRDLLAAERLVAHRDLQLQRAGSTGNARYIVQRERKLRRAQRELARLRALAVELGA